MSADDTQAAARAVKPFQTRADYDTRDYLRLASQQATERNYAAFPIVDVDAHHYETESWADIVRYIDDDVLRHYAQTATVGRAAPHIGLLPIQPGNQDVSGRISRYTAARREKVDGERREVALVKRAMEAIGIDYQVLFPTPMLLLGTHPNPDVEVALARAYTRWLIDTVLSVDESVKTLVYLPFNAPDACLDFVEEFGDVPGVVGFMVTSVRYRAVHDNAYMKLYGTLQERGLPLAFHAGYNWQERSAESLNRFLSVHALTFVWYSMVHLTNWIVNGLPERFPDLDVIWMESGLAWIPFLMQRLDNEFEMRPSEAPLLKRRPSEYMREMYYTNQPMERQANARALELTFEMIDAPSHLLYSSDYPHWDFDLPSVIYDLPFLDEAAKRAILGGTACRLFGIDDPRAAGAANARLSRSRSG
jgi:predicted TIM-barrel fold metal-dependent hydrolase